MTGLKKKHNTMVMDGTNRTTLNEIVGIVGMLAYQNGKGKFTYKPLDEEHPSMFVIEFKANAKDFGSIQSVLDEKYPGLCIYDAAV